MGLYQTIKENDIYISMQRSSSKDAYLYFDLRYDYGILNIM